MTTKHNMELNDMELTQVNGGEDNPVFEALKKSWEELQNWFTGDPVPDFDPVEPVPFDEPCILVDPRMFDRNLPVVVM